VIERAFGILKRRFKVLRAPREASIETQVSLIYALTTIHNYIYIRAGDALEAGLEELLDEEEAYRTDEAIAEASSVSIMNIRRDEIAKKMWEDYIAYIN
jgi:hypothetical protein